LTTVWGFFRLPETKDRTYYELDVMFQKGISARKFSKYKIDGEEVYLNH
jgi:SP family general alpha glucoside:H+ symporter-like MFS transporter